jgi:predicted nuclease of predicted toxin-antitoxin system
MLGFLVDEDLPRSLASVLVEAGFQARDVRDVGLRGKSDAEVFAYAVANGLALISGDLGFASLLEFPLGSHSGIIIARLPNQTPITELNRAVADAIDAVGAADIFGNLVIIEPGRIRLRRKGL